MFPEDRTVKDKYGRTHIIVESVLRKADNNTEYLLYNLYPPNVKPKRSTKNEFGLYYEPYLYITDDTLKRICKRGVDE